MDSEDNVHRLEGSISTKGGLTIKKKGSAPIFKVPQSSLFGLDRLAAQKRKERETAAANKISFDINESEFNEGEEQNEIETIERCSIKRKFREPREETPTYTGGISKEARERLVERLNSSKSKGVYASTKTSRRTENYERRKHRERNKARNRNQSERDDRSSREYSDMSERGKSPRFRDEPRTPNFYTKDTMSKTAWDEDDYEPSRKSTWDYPTPSLHRYKGGDWSERSYTSSKSHRDEKGIF